MKLSTSPRGMTIIELVIAATLLSIVATMSLVGIQASGQQAHFTSRRADIMRRANTTLLRLERELEGASYQDQDNAVGAFQTGPRTVNFAVAGTTGQNAVQLARITDATTDPVTVGSTIIYAFEQVDTNADTDNDGLVSEYRLIRIQDGREVVIQDNILSSTQPGINSGTAPANPSFLITAPSDLQISFSLGTSVGFAGGQRQYEVVTAVRNLNLRNLNQ